MTAAIAIIWSQESLPTPPTILHHEHGHTYLPNLASLASRSAYLPALARHLLPTKIVAQRLSMARQQQCIQRSSSPSAPKRSAVETTPPTPSAEWRRRSSATVGDGCEYMSMCGDGCHAVQTRAFARRGG
eukprot:COSAG06_NODE_26_length_32102_cov_250.952911_28_plen_130_part_00